MTGPFIIYPAIDLHLGQVVRLSQGDLERQTVYSLQPGEAARTWLEAGAAWLHVVNLDGAFEKPDQANRTAFQEILAEAQGFTPARQVQLGGGLRSLEGALEALEMGASRVVLGTAAVQTPELVRQLLERVGPDRVAVGLDAREGKIRLRGWTEASALQAEEMAVQFAEMGLRTVIHTDIARDGVGTGVNIAASRSVAQVSGLDVIASGGVHSLEDIRRVRQAGLSGVIVGRALYEGSLALQDALEVERG